MVGRAHEPQTSAAARILDVLDPLVAATQTPASPA
jgi:hypothetical protein